MRCAPEEFLAFQQPGQRLQRQQIALGAEPRDHAFDGEKIGEKVNFSFV